jgi:hypothetical protein
MSQAVEQPGASLQPGGKPLRQALRWVEPPGDEQALRVLLTVVGR